MAKSLKSIWRISYKDSRLRNFLRALVGFLKCIGMLPDRLEIRKTPERQKIPGKFLDERKVTEALGHSLKCSRLGKPYEALEYPWKS